MHLVLAATDSRDELRRELDAAMPSALRELHPGLFACEPLAEERSSFPPLVFARQLFPNAREVSAPSIRTWASLIVDAIIGVLPDEQPWSLQVAVFRPVEAERIGARAWHTQTRGGGARGGKSAPRETPREAIEAPRKDEVGEHRAHLVRDAVVEILRKRRRHLLRSLRAPGLPFVKDEALVQLLLVTADSGYLSITPSPLPYEQRRVISCFPAGDVAVARDPEAPSRAFAKLVEAEARLGCSISEGETCVDLGASPGGWTYVAVRRGARVVAVDRSELREDLMRHPLVRYVKGDAFKFEPEKAVDWLVCDVIAGPERAAQMLVRWAKARWCRHFVVTLKLIDDGSSDAIALLEREMPALTSEFGLLRLSANKKEICAFGTLSDELEKSGGV